MNSETYPSPELTNKLEVFTDDAQFIGPNDSSEGLYAYPVSCGVLTLDNRETGTVGIIHISEGRRANEVLMEASGLIRSKGLNFNAFKLRRFQGSETIWEDAEQSMKKYGIKLPVWEYVQEPRVIIHKNNGEVTFF